MDSIMPTVAPVRGSEGADIIEPRNTARERQNPSGNVRDNAPPWKASSRRSRPRDRTQGLPNEE
jgi:hypothetical protein